MANFLNWENYFFINLTLCMGVCVCGGGGIGYCYDQINDRFLALKIICLRMTCQFQYFYTRKKSLIEANLVCKQCAQHCDKTSQNVQLQAYNWQPTNKLGHQDDDVHFFYVRIWQLSKIISPPAVLVLWRPPQKGMQCNFKLVFMRTFMMCSFSWHTHNIILYFFQVSACVCVCVCVCVLFYCCAPKYIKLEIFTLVQTRCCVAEMMIMLDPVAS